MNLSVRGKRRLKAAVTNGIMIVIMVFYLLPFWYVVNNAFKERSYISLQPFTINLDIFTLDNIISAFSKMNYPVAFFNSFSVLVISCLIFILLGSMTAYGIYIADHKFFNRLYVLFVALIALPFQAAMVPLVTLLRTLHLSDNFFGLALIYSAMFMPFIVFLYTGFMRSLPKELMESARIDGCSEARIFFQMVLPMSRPIVVYTVISSFLVPWMDFVYAKMILNAGISSKYTVAIGLYKMLDKSLINSYFTQFCAGGVLVSVPISILFMIMQKFYVEGITGGAVKG